LKQYLQDKFEFKMEKIEMNHLTLPDSYAGRWKVIYEFFVTDDYNEKYHTCIELRGDLIII
jgi:hypothetical protein